MMLVNGQAQEYIAVADRGLQYGDGLFETVAVNAGSPRLWERHRRRLASGCRRLGIGEIDPDTLWHEIREVCSGVDKGVLKVIVTRGAGSRGYRPGPAARPTRIVATYPWPDYPAAHWQEGVAVRMCATRMGRNAALAGLKHLNRLEQVLARREWDDPRIAEGLMQDEDGHVVSGTMTNLFIADAGRLMTSPLTACGVEGVMRGVILDMAAESGIACEVASLTRQELDRATEVFVCNALIGIWPVQRIEQREYAVGPLTVSLGERLRVYLRDGNSHGAE
jgi:4-amino-4-deoxychorismate lyase